MIKPGIRTLASAASLAAFAWTSFAAAIALGQKRLLFNPTSRREVDRPRSEVHRTRSVVLRGGDGTRLSGWFLTPRRSTPMSAVIYFGGRSEEVSWVVRDAGRMFPHSAVLALNYRGYGESHGAPSELQMIADGEFLFDWLAERSYIDKTRIALVGRSLGSGVALQVATRRPAAGLVLLTPYDSILAIARRRFRTVPVGWMLRDRFESVKHASLLTAPVYVLRAQSDTVVPSAHTDLLVKSLSTVVADISIPGSDHCTLPYLPAAQEAIAAIVATVLGGGTGRPTDGDGPTPPSANDEVPRAA
ncbi:MAG: alpha/beta hydrolase [Herminiimonas sp.]|nr:alpha/beta hydrolase [Herminiimonas sp.]MDB5852366.1 alpha/beta hydrolase [Herminiimonas sp.]